MAGLLAVVEVLVVIGLLAGDGVLVVSGQPGLLVGVGVLVLAGLPTVHLAGLFS